MQTIIAPVDFSDTSLNAAFYAADMACALGARLQLLHICALPLPVSEVPVSENDVEMLVTEADERMQLLKEKVDVSTGDKLMIEGEVKQGDVLSGIEDYCNTLKPFAVVMGAETAGPLARVMIGGKTLAAISNLSYPVVVVPQGVHFKKWRNIALACDPRNPKSIPMQKIRLLTETLNGRLQVLHVGEGKGPGTEAYDSPEWSWLRKEPENVMSAFQFIDDTDVERGLMNWIKTNQPDLLIVVPQKHSTLHRLFYGSHSQRMALHTPIPLMSIHA